jgi:signal transduction histidine kinase
MRLSVVMRLTLWYAGIFTVSSAVAFVLFYLLITTLFRQQIDEELTGQAAELKTVMDLRGIDAVKRVAILEARAAGIKKIFIRLLSPTGFVFSSSNMDYWQNIEVSRPALERLLSGQSPVYDTISVSDGKDRIRVLYSFIAPGIVLQLGRSMESYGTFIRIFKRIFIVTMAGLTLLATVVGWFLARRAMSGVERVTRTAGRISAGRLDERVPVKQNQDEIDQLAQSFNRMVDRIQDLVTDIKEMSDNIAHDLKSPLTRIRGAAEVTLTTGSAMADYQSMAASIIEDCDRLLDLINTTLTISKTEAGIADIEKKELDLTAVVNDACTL